MTAKRTATVFSWGCLLFLNFALHALLERLYAFRRPIAIKKQRCRRALASGVLTSGRRARLITEKHHNQSQSGDGSLIDFPIDPK
jgi:hypothetical protein